MERGTSDINQVFHDLMTGNALLWLAFDGETPIGAGVTQIIQEQTRKVCEIIAWASDKKCTPLLSIVHEYAKAEGCMASRLIGRKGWAKALPEYKIRALVMERPL